MMPPLRSFDDLDGKERGQKKTDNLRAMTTLGPRKLQHTDASHNGGTIQHHMSVRGGGGLRILPDVQHANVDHNRYINNEAVHEISNNVVCTTSKASDQPAHTRSLVSAFASR